MSTVTRKHGQVSLSHARAVRIFFRRNCYGSQRSRDDDFELENVAAENVAVRRGKHEGRSRIRSRDDDDDDFRETRQSMPPTKNLLY